MTNTIDEPIPQIEDGVFRCRNPHDPALHVPVGTLVAWWSAHFTEPSTRPAQDSQSIPKAAGPNSP